MPFLDLDTAMNNSQIAKSFAAAAQTKLSQLAPARVIPIADHSWPGAGTVDTVRRLTNETGTRTMLIGTVRRVDQKFSVSIHLVDGSSGETLLQRRILLDDLDGTPLRLSDLVAAEFSSVLNGVAQVTKPDPALQNRTASEYLRAGHEFEGRRGKTDLDHALACFERAVRLRLRPRLREHALPKLLFLASITRRARMSCWLRRNSGVVRRSVLTLRSPKHTGHWPAYFTPKGICPAAAKNTLEAIELGGLDEGPVMSVATIDKIFGRPDLSLRWHEIARLIQEHPSDYEFSMADCWANLCADEEAESIYRRVSALHPDLPEGWAGVCRLRLLRGDFEAARRIYREKIDSFSEFPFALQTAAQVEFFSRNWPEAEQLYQRLAQTDPEGGGEVLVR